MNLEDTANILKMHRKAIFLLNHFAVPLERYFSFSFSWLSYSLIQIQNRAHTVLPAAEGFGSNSTLLMTIWTAMDLFFIYQRSQ